MIFPAKCFRQVRSVEPISQASHSSSGVTVQSSVLGIISQQSVRGFKCCIKLSDSRAYLYKLQPERVVLLGM